MYLAQKPIDDLKRIEMTAALQLQSNTEEEIILQAIKVNFEVVQTFVMKNTNLIDDIDLCRIRSKYIEDGDVPYCRMCDPDALPTTTQYVNTQELAENITLKCVEDPSVLDLLTDVVLTTGENIFKEMFSWSTNLLRYAVIIIIAIIIIVASGFFYNKFVAKRTNVIFPIE